MTGHLSLTLARPMQEFYLRNHRAGKKCNLKCFPNCLDAEYGGHLPNTNCGCNLRGKLDFFIDDEWRGSPLEEHTWAIVCEMKPASAEPAIAVETTMHKSLFTTSSTDLDIASMVAKSQYKSKSTAILNNDHYYRVVNVASVDSSSSSTSTSASSGAMSTTSTCTSSARHLHVSFDDVDPRGCEGTRTRTGKTWNYVKTTSRWGVNEHNLCFSLMRRRLRHESVSDGKAASDLYECAGTATSSTFAAYSTRRFVQYRAGAEPGSI